MIICVFNSLRVVVMAFIIIYFNILARFLLWIIHNDKIPEKYILLVASCINTTIMIGIVEELYRLFIAFRCKCELTSMPTFTMLITQETQTDL